MIIGLLITLGACEDDQRGTDASHDVGEQAADGAQEVCTPDCGEIECGGDGCGGECGTCEVGFECQAGLCAQLPGCIGEEPCDDGNECTYDDLCADEICTGTEYVCDDGKECTADDCDGAGDCSYSVLPGRCLISGKCYEDGELHTDSDCRECQATSAATAWTNDDDNECSDSDACTVGDACLEGECIPGTGTPDCDDNNPCTEDLCDADSGCASSPIDGACDDGNSCTQSEVCVDSQCLGEPMDCDDGNDCTQDDCAPESGCKYEPLPGDCDDGDPCSVGDFCSDGTCKPGGTPLNCDDLNECTDDSCDQAAGCFYLENSVECDDGDACTIGDVCGIGQCQPGAGTPPCDDGNDCTDDSCDPAVGCINANNVAECDDGNICSIGDQCAGGGCQPGNVVLACDDGDACTDDVCQPDGGCQHVLNNAPCSDGNECTENDICDAGTCAGFLKSCDDLNVCTIDGCNPFVPGGCTHAPNDAGCDDGNDCTLGDTCAGSQCLPGAGQKNCDDGNDCTEDVCDPDSGCVHSNIVGFCEDDNPCTQSDYCANGQCNSGPNVCLCTTNQDCLIQENGDLCDGTLFCDIASIPYSCKVNPTTVVTCNPALNTQCSNQKCVPATGNCVPEPVNSGVPCDDQDGCTSQDKCNAGICSGILCSAQGMTCVNGECVVQACGDGQVAAPEECDDGNEQSCDGCLECERRRSLLFDGGAGHYLAVTDVAGKPLSLAGTNFTVEGWFRMEADDEWVKVFHRAPGNNGWAFGVQWNGVRVARMPGFDHWPDVPIMGTGWRHVAWTWDGAMSRIWLDGKLLSAKSYTQAIVDTSAMTIIGAYVSAAGQVSDPHKGRADELRVSDVVRYTQDFVPQPRHESDGSTVALWHFDEGTGTAVTDSSSHGHPGVATGMIWEQDNCFGSAPDSIICGDGKLALWEECDDGNQMDGDGCSSECKLETMALVPAGSFMMGCNVDVDVDCGADEYPYHQVSVGDFLVDILETTVDEYAVCVSSGQCTPPSTSLADCQWGKAGKGGYPVNCVTWDQAKSYCQWQGKRLCTEAEWEKAARNGDGRKYPWGNSLANCNYGVMYSGSKGCGTGGPLPVGSKPAGASPYGALDMAGNVWEYVEDCHHGTYVGAPVDGSAWEKPGCGNAHVIRSGSFWSTAPSLRASKRLAGTPGNGGFDIHVAGIRCCQ